MRTCEWCHQSFTPAIRRPSQRYCTRRCGRRQRDSAKRAIELRACAVCGATLVGRPDKVYCSRRCKHTVKDRVRADRRVQAARRTLKALVGSTAAWDKTCTGCQETLPHTQFLPNAEAPDGRYDVCKLCQRRMGLADRRQRERAQRAGLIPSGTMCSRCCGPHGLYELPHPGPCQHIRKVVLCKRCMAVAA